MLCKLYAHKNTERKSLDSIGKYQKKLIEILFGPKKKFNVEKSKEKKNAMHRKYREKISLTSKKKSPNKNQAPQIQKWKFALNNCMQGALTDHIIVFYVARLYFC